MVVGSSEPLAEIRTRNISWGGCGLVLKADNLTTSMCRLSLNLGATFWYPQGLSRPVQGLLYLYLYHTFYIICYRNIIFYLRLFIYGHLFRKN